MEHTLWDDVAGFAVLGACLAAVGGFVWYVKAILDMVA